eukprot:1364582-Amorphochlora_amoeboformis.AAC.2
MLPLDVGCASIPPGIVTKRGVPIKNSVTYCDNDNTSLSVTYKKVTLVTLRDYTYILPRGGGDRFFVCIHPPLV